MILESPPVHPYGSFWLDVADKSIKAVAVVFAGVWTYLNYLRSRTSKRKLEIGITGEVFHAVGSHYALVICRLKNVGQTKGTIEQTGTALELLSLSAEGRTVLKTSPIFEDHGWIEPGEEVKEPVVLLIPDPGSVVAFMLKLRVVSLKVEWNASCIIREEKSLKEPQ